MSKSVAIIGTRGFPSYYGGFETCVRHLAPYLADHGWDVTVYGRPGSTSPDDPLNQTAVKSVITRGIESKAFSTLSYSFTSQLHARRHKPDVALVMNVASGYFLPILKRAGIPTLVNVDGLEWEREKWGKNARRVFFGGAKMTAKYADRLLFDAQAIAEFWGSQFGREGVYIPYGGHFTAHLPVQPGLTHRGYILMVARLEPENSVDQFFVAAEKLNEHWPVVIVGSSGHNDERDRRAAGLDRRYPNIHWLGHVADDDRLHSLWEHAGVYFHGHSVGGTNPALVQAMAAGAPIVARDTVFNREVLGDDGVFTNAQSPDIVATISRVMTDDDLRTSIAASARARATESFTWDHVNTAHDAVLTELIADTRTSR